MSSPWEKIGNEYFNYEYVYKKIVSVTPEGGKIAEIGCWKGASTMFLAMEAKKKSISIFAIDTWLGSVEHKEMAEVSQKTLFGLFLENMKPVINDINVLRVSSLLASRVFDDKSLDAVFIDADHSYESVKADINCWLPKVKNGGVLAGHDYIGAFAGVIKAVDELLPSREIIECRCNNKCWFFTK